MTNVKKLLFLLLFLALFLNTTPINKVEASTYGLSINGRYWVDTSGKPVFLAGVCYPFHDGTSLWDTYDSTEIDSNLTAIKNNGFNLVVLQVSMARFESTRHVYSGTHWNNLLDMLTRIKNKGMYAMLRTPDYASGYSGWVNATWAKTNWWWNNESFRNDQKWFLQNLTKQIVDEGLQDCIVAIDLWAEADCDTSTKRNFIGVWETGSGVNTTALRDNANVTWHKWLEYRYGTIQKLNDTWKNDRQTDGNPGSALKSWEDSFDKIPLPNATLCGYRYNARAADLRLFHLETWYNITKLRRDAVKTYYNFPVGGSISGYIWRTQPGGQATWKPKQFLEESHIADLLDVIMIDSYGVMQGDFQSLGCYHRRWNKPLMGIEYGIKSTSYNLSEQKRFWTEAYGSMLVQGVAASAIWSWQDISSASSGSYGYGLIWKNGTTKPILPFLNSTNHLVQQIQSDLDKLLFNDDIALIMSQTTLHKLGKIYSYDGFFSIAPIEFQRINVYPTVVFEGNNRTSWDRTLLKVDNVSTLNEMKIVVWQPIDVTFQFNSTWWNETLCPSTAKKIVMGIASIVSGEYKSSSDDYGWSIIGKVNTTVLPFASKRTYNYPSHTAWTWYTNGTCVWGAYNGQSVKYFTISSSPAVTTSFTKRAGFTDIINVTFGSTEYRAVMASNDWFVNLLPMDQSFRWWHPLNNTGTTDQREYEDYNCTILRTALSWFGYTPRFNSTNPYVRINIMNGTSKYVVFANPMSSSQQLTWKLNNLTDYNLTASENYTLTWLHNSTTVGNYTGSQLQSGLTFTIENQTIGILEVTEASTPSSPPDEEDTDVSVFPINVVTDNLLIQYLLSGDFIGFITACYTSKIGQGFYALVLLVVFGVMYNRTQSIALCSIMWLLLGSLWIAATSIVSPIAVILCGLGLAGILYKLFAKSSST